MDLLTITGICIFVIFILRLAFGGFTYWSERNVNGPSPIPLIGNFPKAIFRKETYGRATMQIYEKFPKEKIVGVYVFQSPVLVLRDPDIIKQVLIKDFDCFMNRGLANKNNTLHENLAFAENDRWRLLRQKLNPVFTSNKLKKMFYLLLKCADQLDNYIQHLVDDKVEHDTVDLTDKFTLEAIGNCALGIDLNTFHDEDNIYLRMANRLLENTVRETLLNTLYAIFPGIVKKLRISSDKKEVVKFFLDLVNKLFKEREGKEKLRHDFMDIFIEMKEQGSIKGDMKDEIEMTDVLIAAQVGVFLAAGYETSSSATSLALYELAQNPEIQEKARKEVNAFFNKYEQITYETLNEMKYLEMVYSETLRKYPVIEALIRVSNKKYTFPDSDITIDENVRIFIPLTALHHDPKYYPEPMKFVPERFSPYEKQMRHPCVYMPFGEGPRICIGARFGKLMALVSLATILRKFRIKPSKRMSSPLKFGPVQNILKVIGGVWVDFERR